MENRNRRNKNKNKNKNGCQCNPRVHFSFVFFVFVHILYMWLNGKRKIENVKIHSFICCMYCDRTKMHYHNITPLRWG